jgi:hypothetical protein
MLFSSTIRLVPNNGIKPDIVISDCLFIKLHFVLVHNYMHGHGLNVSLVLRLHKKC